MADSDAWERPPPGVLGYPAQVQFVARSGSAVVALQSVLAFHEGCLLTLVVAVRRNSLDESSWNRFREAMHEGDAQDVLEDGRLTFRVFFPGGAQAETTQRAWDRTNDLPKSPTLAEVNSDFASDDQGLRGQRTVWLWPLPPATPFKFEIEWQQMGLEPAWTMLDGGAIARAADHVTWLWP